MENNGQREHLTGMGLLDIFDSLRIKVNFKI